MTTESSTDTATKLLGALQALLAPDLSATAVGIVNGSFKVHARATQPADSNIYLAAANILAAPNTIAGNVAYTHTLFDSTPVQMTAESFMATGTAALTVAATNFATIALVYNNGNGGTDSTIATGNTVSGGGIGNMTAGVPANFTLTTANITIPAGSCVQVKVTKSGSAGRELGAMTFTAKFRLGA